MSDGRTSNSIKAEINFDERNLNNLKILKYDKHNNSNRNELSIQEVITNTIVN